MKVTNEPADWETVSETYVDAGASAQDVIKLRECVEMHLERKFDAHDFDIEADRLGEFGALLAAEMLRSLDESRPDDHVLHVERLLEDFEAGGQRAMGNVGFIIGVVCARPYCPDELYRLANAEIEQNYLS